ncbi:protein translocase subunit SecF [Nocardioides sp.]|uniref:protein translocase subunit SecF n=1 Tax=Nocardioides sp. TaxID=35761 RepID=UPI00261A505E|nr:protein translocase subunit SecF [Nocardioides sp.]
MGKFSRLGNDLYAGRRSYDFIGRRAVFYVVSAILVLCAVGLVGGKGLNFGIEFTGGTQFAVNLPADQVTQDNAEELRETVADAGIETGDPIVTTEGDSRLIVQVQELDQADTDTLIGVIADAQGIAPEDASNDISVSAIGASLGAQLAQRAAIGVGVFLFLVVLFIWAYSREWKMSVAALMALFHDIVITVGIYALSGFSVTPAAVTGFLAILGFSLYDTVVVFDKVRENTANLRSKRTTYGEAANLAVNQTLVRSVNTSVVALIPIGAILYVSAVQLGSSSLQDLALVQFVGMGVGVYSSVFLAPRILVHLKSNEDDVKLAEKRAKARARAAADPYASVPNFTEDMPIGAGSDEGVDPEDDEEHDEYESGEPDEDEPTRSSSTRSEAMGSGRVAPPARGPMGQSNSSGRVQPSRRTKSQRKK